MRLLHFHLKNQNRPLKGTEAKLWCLPWFLGEYGGRSSPVDQAESALHAVRIGQKNEWWDFAALNVSLAISKKPAECYDTVIYCMLELYVLSCQVSWRWQTGERTTN